MKIWIAIGAEDQVLAHKSLDRALAFLADQVPQVEWERFYDALSPADQASLTRDKNEMSPELLLNEWGGRLPDEGAYVWGFDLFTMRIVEQDLVD